MEHDIPFGNFNRENGTTFLDFPLFLGIFQWDEPTKRVPFTAEPEILEILTKWKAPIISILTGRQVKFPLLINKLSGDSQYQQNRNFNNNNNLLLIRRKYLYEYIQMRLTSYIKIIIK